MNAEEIFHRAAEIEDPSGRAAYLDQACRADATLRAEVESLLKAHDKAGSFLEGTPAGVTVESPARTEGPGTRIGRYDLLELLGEGGMGLVYLAQQQEPVKRRVALKIIKPGMDSKQVIARFEAERQALALLDHPNIAHVFDAGCTETGRPYFVMEQVKGMSITRYCDEHKLDIEQRLRLFEQVCEAVQHAHQKGIIHRDLKPSNILVTLQGDRPVPKIIDFGIAKATSQSLTEGTMFTYQGQFLGTPEYMSPEQADLGTQDIDTRSDIYSLGVVLYELLAGVLPFESESFTKVGLAEIQRTIREQEPASPSARLTQMGDKAKVIAESRGTQVVPLARRLHRELEWIPLKAMRKDRCRRYRSASEMADDIHNYLNGRPLIAGPETAVYRVQKFVRKHAGSVAMVALVALAIILGLVVSTTMYFRAESMRVQAEQARQAEQEQRQVAQSRAEDLRRSLYVNSIQLADAKYREGNMSGVRDLLASCPNDLRGWEWNRLSRVADQSVRSFHVPAAVYDSFVSPDGRRILSPGGDKTIRVWDPTTGREILAMRGHKDDVLCISSDAAGRRVVSGDRGGVVKIWDANRGSELTSLPAHRGRVLCVRYSPDGAKVASCGEDMTVRLWDSEKGTELMTLLGHTEWVTSVAFSADGRRIASSDVNGMIKVWDAVSDGEPLTIQGNNKPLLSVGLSTDGKLVASGGRDRTVRIWDADTGNGLSTMRGHNGDVETVAFSGNSKRLVSGSEDGAIKLWDVSTGTESRTLSGHGSCLSWVAFADHEGERIMSGDREGALKMWDATRNEEVALMRGHTQFVSSVAFSPDGKYLASGSHDRTVRLWDVSAHTERTVFSGHTSNVRSVAFSPNGKLLASGSTDGTLKLWDLATGKEVMSLQANVRVPGKYGEINCVCFDPDGRMVFVGGREDMAKAYSTADGREVMTLSGLEHYVWSIAFTRDGNRLAVGAEEGVVKIWDTNTRAEVLTLRRRDDEDYSVYAIAFSPDGTQIATCGEVTKVWDMQTGREIMGLRGYTGVLGSIAYTPDGRRIVGGGDAVTIWDAETGTELMTLHDGQPDVWSIAVAPDGRYVAGGDQDGIVRMWEAATSVD